MHWRIKELKKEHKEKTTNPKYREFWINIIRQKHYIEDKCNYPNCNKENREDTIFCDEHQYQYENSEYYK